MTVFDWILIIVFAQAALWGLKTGLIESVLTIVSVYVAMLLSGQFAYRLVNFFTDEIESRAVATAIGYVAIFALVFIGARIVGKVLRHGAKMLMMGWLDRAGGAVFGAAAGLLLMGGVVAVGARFVYDPGTKLPIPVDVGAFRDRVRGWMVDANLTSFILDVRGAVPGEFLALMPADFARSLDALKVDIDAAKGSGG